MHGEGGWGLSCRAYFEGLAAEKPNGAACVLVLATEFVGVKTGAGGNGKREKGGGGDVFLSCCSLSGSDEKTETLRSGRRYSCKSIGCSCLYGITKCLTHPLSSNSASRSFNVDCHVPCTPDAHR